MCDEDEEIKKALVAYWSTASRLLYGEISRPAQEVALSVVKEIESVPKFKCKENDENTAAAAAEKKEDVVKEEKEVARKGSKRSKKAKKSKKKDEALAELSEIAEEAQPGASVGYISICSADTRQEVVKRMLMGGPGSTLAQMRRCLGPRTIVCVFDRDAKTLIGPFRCKCPPAENIEPNAFSGRFKAQARLEAFATVEFKAYSVGHTIEIDLRQGPITTEKLLYLSEVYRWPSEVFARILQEFQSLSQAATRKRKANDNEHTAQKQLSNAKKSKASEEEEEEEENSNYLKQMAHLNTQIVRLEFDQIFEKTQDLLSLLATKCAVSAPGRALVQITPNTLPPASEAMTYVKSGTDQVTLISGTEASISNALAAAGNPRLAAFVLLHAQQIQQAQLNTFFGPLLQRETMRIACSEAHIQVFLIVKRNQPNGDVSKKVWKQFYGDNNRQGANQTNSDTVTKPQAAAVSSLSTKPQSQHDPPKISSQPNPPPVVSGPRHQLPRFLPAAPASMPGPYLQQPIPLVPIRLPAQLPLQAMRRMYPVQHALGPSRLPHQTSRPYYRPVQTREQRPGSPSMLRHQELISRRRQSSSPLTADAYCGRHSSTPAATISSNASVAGVADESKVMPPPPPTSSSSSSVVLPARRSNPSALVITTSAGKN